MGEWTTLNGWALSRGIRLLDMEPHDFLDLITYWLFEPLGEESAMRLERDLTTPPASAEPAPDDPTWGADAELAAFFGATKSG